MTVLQNTPDLWRTALPRTDISGHKYNRGCVVVFGGGKMTGAARLACTAAMRIGAGVCVLVAPESAGAVYRSSLPPHIIVEDIQEDMAAHLLDPRRNAVVIGPGAGDMDKLREKVLLLLSHPRPTVLDADALTVFSDAPDNLFRRLHRDCVLTPHRGEFARLFPELATAPPPEAVRSAADKAGCTVLLKGASTAIAAFGEGQVLMDDRPAPYLATAGSGDVLAGMIAGLMAQGMPSFLAACAGEYLHRQIGADHGPGLVAPDLVESLPEVLARLI